MTTDRAARWAAKAAGPKIDRAARRAARTASAVRGKAPVETNTVSPSGNLIPTLTLKGDDGATITLYRYPDGTVGLFLDTKAQNAVVLERDDLAPIMTFIAAAFDKGDQS